MKRFLMCLLFVAVALLGGCDLLDPDGGPSEPGDPGGGDQTLTQAS